MNFSANTMIQKPPFLQWLKRGRIATCVLASILALLPVAKGDPTAYLATDLVSDQPGVAPILDPHLVNAWGISLGPNSPFWVSSEGNEVSNLYAGDVTTPLMKLPLEVSVPGGHPTGQAFNGTSDFVVSSGNFSGPAIFIFASLTGEVRGWNPNVPPSSTVAQLAYASPGSVYTGITLANNSTGNFLYLADFQNGKIDVLDHAFSLVHLAGGFTEPTLPADYAPFNVAAIGGRVYVAYAKRDANGEEVVGAHLGVISVFDTNGNFETRLASRGALNAPWAMVFAPAGFGDFSSDLLVGNFGDGRINAFNPTTGAYLGPLNQSPDHPLEIDGLRGLTFGNGTNGGSSTTLYYAAGPDNELHGLFGKITANPAGTNPVKATLSNGVLAINGSLNDDQVDVSLSNNGQQILVFSYNQHIGSFDLVSVSRIEFKGWAGDDHIAVANEIAIPTILDGGAGNDKLNGGGGNNILIGGPGDDDLRGSVNRDILIGADGSDKIRGGSEDDLLISGATAYDGNIAALLQILGEWTSSNSYETRISNLRSGAGGLPKLDATTVFDDGTVDTLRGNQGLDWFFAAPNDALPDRQPPEQVN